MTDYHPQFRWASAGMSSTGNVRDINEDAYLDAPNRGMWAVADGMGGHDAGDVASGMIVQSLDELDTSQLTSASIDRIRDTLRAVNSHLYTMGSNLEGNSTIGSTVAVMLAQAGQCILCWAGDSRVYRLRDFRLTQLTRDHSEVEFLVAERGWSRQDAEQHPDSSVILRAVGGQAGLDLEVCAYPLKSRDRNLLCTDGLTRELEAAEIAQILSRGSCIDACRNLIQSALSRRCQDNVTVVAVDFEEIG